MNRGAVGLLALLVPLILAAVNVRVMASEPYLRVEYTRRGFPEAPSFGAAQRMAAAVPSAAFIVRSDGPDVLAALQHDGAPLYTVAEVGHLVDVQRLVGVLQRAAALGAAVIAVCAAWRWRRGDRHFLGRVMGAGGWVTVAVVALAAFGVLFAWPVVFVGFHKLLFPPGTWEFPADSSLIRLFPEVFWQDVATVFAVLTLLEAALLVFLGKLGGRHAGAGTH